MKPKRSASSSYWHFLFEREQRIDWAVIALECFLMFLIMHICYPFPGCKSDSYTYIDSAVKNQFSIYRPFGFSELLRIIHLFSKSCYAVHIAHTGLYFVTVSLVIFALKRYNPLGRKWMHYLFLTLTAVSPVAMYMLDTVMSDSLFCAAVFLMAAMLIVMLHEWSWAAMGLYLAGFLVALFTRYSAMFFPIALVPALLFVEKPVRRWAAIAGTALVFLIFYDNVSSNMKRIAGHRQLSTGFSGWQLANNALHALPYIDDIRPQQIRDHHVRAVHNFCYHHFDDEIRAATDDGKKPTAVIMWSKNMPLKRFQAEFMKMNRVPYSTSWIRLGKLYGDYGRWLILHRPGKFIRYYLGPNTKWAFLPQTEMVGEYMPDGPGGEEVSNWFDIPAGVSRTAPRHPVFEGRVKHVLPWIDLFSGCS